MGRVLVRSVVCLLMLSARAMAADVHRAASAGDMEWIRHYVEDGGDPNVKDPNGITPLHAAAYEGRDDVVEYLLLHGGDVHAKGPHDQTALISASKANQVKVAKLLLESGAEVNGADAGGAGPLYWAARFDHPEMARLLIESGAKVDEHDNNGQTALHLAAYFGFPNVVRVLVEHGADPLARRSDGMTPVTLAANTGNGPVLTLLVGDHPLELRAREDLSPELDAAGTTRAVSLLTKLGYLGVGTPNSKVISAAIKSFQRTALIGAADGKSSPRVLAALELLDERLSLHEDSGRQRAVEWQCRWDLKRRDPQVVTVAGGCRAGMSSGFLENMRKRIRQFAQATTPTNRVILLSETGPESHLSAIWADETDRR